MEIPSKLQEAIINNKLVVFAGSGLSTKFNLPSWIEFVKAIINKSDNINYKSFLAVLEADLMKPIEVLEKISSEHNEIEKYIAREFKISKGDFSLHEKILKLSGQIITTNYDDAFEIASSNTIVPSVYTSAYRISEINKNDEPYIFKLHGSYTEPDHCIVFNKQYENLYLEDTAAKEKLKSIFAERTILFIGFSFNDSDINLIFENLDKAFGNNNTHFILTTQPKEFEKFKFLRGIKLKDYNEIDGFIDTCLNYKKSTIPTLSTVAESTLIDKKRTPSIVLLWPNPIDLTLDQELSKIFECFDSVEVELFLGTLNIKTLETLEDYDLIFIASQIFKSKLYIEDDNLKSNLLSPEEICSNIPNDSIPIIFITNEKIEPVDNRETINISTLKRATIKRFIYKALKEKKINFENDDEISMHLSSLGNAEYLKGRYKVSSLYKNDRILDIGKKCLLNVIGRVEEQASIALKLLNIYKTNKLLNIKASGGTGKTTIIKKVAYELYNRGYYKQGVRFKSCESVKSLNDFEEILINGFNLIDILNLKDYLIENYSNNKIDLLIILDNFETVVTNLNKNEFSEVLELLKFATDFANIVITSRERLSPLDDFEDIFSLTPLITDDALTLFEKHYGKVIDEDEIKILRQDILEDLLNNNPLAINLVIKSRTRSKHIYELKGQLQEYFFESINEDYTAVFKNNADLNIERTKSIYQSINYSYTTLSNKEKIAFEILSLFPDGISLSNFKKCFQKNNSSNNISDTELRNLRDKSLVEDDNGTLQLQPIIRRFADFQFNKRPKEIKRKYCLDAYTFNAHILSLIEYIENVKSTSDALKLYNSFKNNLLNVLSYIPEIDLADIKISEPKKRYFLNYIYHFESFIVNEKQINEFHNKLGIVQSYFSDLPNAETLIKVLDINKRYYYNEFDKSYKELSQILSVEDMEKRTFKNEDYIEARYKNMIANIYSMEGYTIQKIRSFILNDNTSKYLDAHFFYLGIVNNISSRKDGFYYYEYELMFDRIDIPKLEEYINSLHSEQHLEIMQSTYALSKVKILERKTIQKMVVTNPYTNGLKQLMFAFISTENEEKMKLFEDALFHLSHIKYYYLEALYYYCLFLRDVNLIEYKNKLSEGINLSNKFYYQYLSYLFENIETPKKKEYEFTYDYYPLEGLEDYVNKHNSKWEKEFKYNEFEN